MKNQEYIQSGILESYLLGIVSEEEQREVEQRVLIDNEVAKALQSIEIDIANHYLTNAVPPPPNVREAILLNANKNELKKWQQQNNTFKKATNHTEQPKYLEVEVDNTHIKVHKYWRPAFIAVFVLSKIFLIAALYFYFKSDSLTKENERLKQEIKLK